MTLLSAPLLGIKSNKLTKHGFGRDALFKEAKMREEYLKHFQKKAEIAVYREKLMLK